MLTSAYPVSEEGADKIQLQRKQLDAQATSKFILSGKAIRGAIRHRAVRILKTMEVEPISDFVDNLFGTAGKDIDAIKSRVYINESILNSSVKKMIQDRIKIDRWTGGVIGGAKFDSEPVWNTDQDSFEIQLYIQKPKLPEINLILQVMKDLFTADLAIGGEKNVGRGILLGHQLLCEWEGQQSIITKSDNKIDIENKAFFTNLQKVNYEPSN